MDKFCLEVLQMMTFREFLTEIFGDDERVYKNPTKEVLSAAINKSKWKQHRYVNHNGNSYFADAATHTHGDIARKSGFEQPDREQVGFVSKAHINVMRAKKHSPKDWAHEDDDPYDENNKGRYSPAVQGG
jgi:hypothetical protein